MADEYTKAKNGFTPIPNQLLEFLCSKNGRVLNACDRAVFDMLLRYSIGYQGDKSKSVYEARISQSFIGNATGMIRTNVNRSIKKLITLQWIQKVRKRLYRLLLLERINNDTFAEDANVSTQINKGIESDNKIVSNQIPNKEIKKTYKEKLWKPLQKERKRSDD